jgi:hypothetical protein
VKKVIFLGCNIIEIVTIIILGKLHLIKKNLNRGENDFAIIVRQLY